MIGAHFKIAHFVGCTWITCCSTIRWWRIPNSPVWRPVAPHSSIRNWTKWSQFYCCMLLRVDRMNWFDLFSFFLQIHRHRSFVTKFHRLCAPQYTNNTLEWIMRHGLWLQHIRMVDMEIEFGWTHSMHFGHSVGGRGNSTTWSRYRFIVLLHNFDDSVRDFGIC